MDQRMREELKKIYAAPAPAGKRAFFRAVQPQPVRIHYMLWIQAAYISKCTWILAAVFFGIILFLSRYYEIALFVTVIAVMPLLAAGSVTESMRSFTYGMRELEMSARFSAKSVILARMCILGTVNILSAFFCALFVQGKYMCTVLYLLVPYLAAVYLCLLIVRIMPGRDGIYACTAGSFGLSMLAIGSILGKGMWIYEERHLYVWLAAAVLLACMSLKEGRRTLRSIESCFV